MSTSSTINIGNWREYPNSKWSFQHVDQLIKTKKIKTSKPSSLINSFQDFNTIKFESLTDVCDINSLLTQTYTDGFLVLHQGKVVNQWKAPHFDPNYPHIVFSVSKSITAILTGILEAQGIIDCEAPVVDYLPNAKVGVYGSCRVRHLLDMTVALNFEENYTDKNSEYIQYRQATAWNPMNPGNPGPGLESFLYSLSKSLGEHGEAFLYRSPNTDLLGLILERASGETLADLLGKYLWQPMGAEMDGYITVDRFNAPRSAGGICIGLEDLGRIGLLFLNNGKVKKKQVIPEQWIEDTYHNGNQSAWDKGNYKSKLPNYRYRNQWYQMRDNDGAICARGIHGQLLYINPTRSIVIVRVSSHPDPLNENHTNMVMTAFEKIAKEFG